MSFLLRPPITTLARRVLGSSRYFPLREAYLRYRESATLWADARWAASIERLSEYRNRHRGERCFILGNGPSLKKTDLSPLKDEVTFGLNRIYLLFDEMQFTTTYHVTVNKLVIEQCAHEMAALLCPKFISWESRDLIDFTPDMAFLPRGGFGFQGDIVKGVWEGATVTYVALQIAYYMGFETVILVGVDHSYVTAGQPHTTVISEADDPDHFDPRYFGKGFRWQLPDLETSELAYRIARYHYERANRRVVDATIGGNLNVFCKVDYYELFK